MARNRGMAASTGAFVAFLDADDLWTPEKLERQHAALLARPEAGVAYSWNLFIDELGRSLGQQTPVYFEGNVYGELLVQDFLVCGSTILVRREAIEATGEFDPELKNYQTVDYWRRLARYWSFVLVPEHQIIRRIVSGSHSSDLKRHETFMMMAIEKSFQDAPAEYRSLKPKSIALHYQHLAHKYLERELDSNGIRMAGAKLWTAIRHYPALVGDRGTQRTMRDWFLLSVLGPRGFERLAQVYRRVKSGEAAGAANAAKP
ncbi:MAG: glycosyltransferase [Cyanobacteria bacterium J06648_11]